MGAKTSRRSTHLTRRAEVRLEINQLRASDGIFVQKLSGIYRHFRPSRTRLPDTQHQFYAGTFQRHTRPLRKRRPQRPRRRRRHPAEDHQLRAGRRRLASVPTKAHRRFCTKRETKIFPRYIRRRRAHSDSRQRLRLPNTSQSAAVTPDGSHCRQHTNTSRHHVFCFYIPQSRRANTGKSGDRRQPAAVRSTFAAFRTFHCDFTGQAWKKHPLHAPPTRLQISTI